MKGKTLLVLLLGAATVWLLPFGAASDEQKKNVDWPNYGNDLHNTRFQDVDRINRKNVHRLRPAWVFHTRTIDPADPAGKRLDPLAELQVAPIIVGGRMFVTDGHDHVFALNAATGAKIWEFDPTLDGMPPIRDMIVCCGRNNKGVAVADGKVIYGRLDNVVVALNAATGAVVWRRKLPDQPPAPGEDFSGFAINNAPQIANGVVVISLSGGEFEVRGKVFGLNLADGTVKWRFQTTDPASYGAPASDQFQRGGAAVWNPVAIDRELGLVYMPTGNAAPDILGQHRPGDNRFATSIIALHLETGLLAWNFQEVHHDIWDYDSAQPAVLFPVTKNGRSFKALGHCSKNGQYYILDRRTGAPIFRVEEQPVPPDNDFQRAAPTQPFSVEIEALTPLRTVRPNDTGVVERPQYTPPGRDLFLMVPGDDGGCEWGPAAFSPRTKLVYYGTRYEPTTFQTKPNNTDLISTQTGDLHLGSRFTNSVPGSHPFGLFGALDVKTGKIKWTFPKVNNLKDFKLRDGEKDILPAKSGLAVAGDLVFFGEGNGKFHAADAENGKILFTFDPRQSDIPNVGGAAASPSVYVANGREFVVYAFGGNVPDRNNFASFVDPDSGKVGDAIIAFALPDEEDEDDD